MGTYQGADTIGDALRSLARQTLAADRFEVLVAQNGPPDHTAAVLDEVCSEYPRLAVRRIEYSTPGAGRARNVGMAMARGEYVTFIDDDDTVSERYLEALLACSAPDTVGAAYMAEVHSRGAPPDFSLTRLLPQLLHAGQTLTPGEILVVLTYNVGKMLPTVLARAVGFDPDLRSGEDIDFYMRFFTQFPLLVRIAPIESHAVYYRAVVPNSVSRQPESYDFNVTQRLDVIERIRGMELMLAWEQRGSRRMINSQTTFINRFLRGHPHLHADVLADIRGRGLTARFSYGRLNAGVAHDLLVLGAAPPFTEGAENGLLHRVHQRAAVVDVVSPHLRRVRPLDRSPHYIWREYVETSFKVRTRSPLDTGWQAIAAFCRGGLEHIEEREQVKGRYRSIRSASAFPAPHLLAALYKLRRPEVPWVAELCEPSSPRRGEPACQGDPMVEQELRTELRKGVEALGYFLSEVDEPWELAELLPFALADRIVFPGESRQAVALAGCADTALAQRALARSVVEPYPVPRAELYHLTEAPYVLEPGPVHIGYFGASAGTRRPAEVLAALRALDPGRRSRLRLHVFVHEGDAFAEHVSAFGLEDVVSVNPALGYLDHLNLTTRLDVLLLGDSRAAGAHQPGPGLPPQFADYAGSGTSVWGLVEAGGELSDRRLEYRSALGDVAGARGVLRHLAERPPPRRSGSGSSR